MINNQKITIRFRPLKDKKKQSVFLDYSPPVPHPKKPNKVMRFQFLHEWLYIKPSTPFEKQHNGDVMERCQKIRNKIENEYLKEDIYSPFELERLKIKDNDELNFIDIMKRQQKLKSGISNKQIYNATIKLLIDFNGSETLKLKDINSDLIENFRQYLLNAESLRNEGTKLSKTTASNYLQKFRSTLLYCYNNGRLIREPLHNQVKAIERDRNLPIYLTDSEIQLLVKQPTENSLLYRTTMFMILTGLRISDVLNLKWEDVKHEGNKCYISIKIKKQKKPVKHHINQQALKLMGNEDVNSQLVFKGLSEDIHRKELEQWCYNVGIDKKISWHKLRHTFAVLMLKKTKDIFMLKKLMHHEDIKSTMVYAHVLDEDKRKAMDRFTIDNL